MFWNDLRSRDYAWRINLTDLHRQSVITRGYRKFHVFFWMNEELRTLRLTNDDIGERFLHLATTRAPLGGNRWWLKCPECDQRKTTLYVLGKRLGCMGCLNLTYPSKHESKDKRVYSKLSKLNFQLGGGGQLSGLPTRPKGMHRKKYDKILAVDQDIRYKVFMNVEAQIAKTKRLLAKYGIDDI